MTFNFQSTKLVLPALKILCNFIILLIFKVHYKTNIVNTFTDYFTPLKSLIKLFSETLQNLSFFWNKKENKKPIGFGFLFQTHNSIFGSSNLLFLKSEKYYDIV